MASGLFLIQANQQKAIDDLTARVSKIETEVASSADLAAVKTLEAGLRTCWDPTHIP